MRKILLLILMFLMTGCTAKYELTIEKGIVNEKLILKSEIKDASSKDEMYGQFFDEYPIYYDEEFLYYVPTQKKDGIEYYEKTIIETKNGYESVHQSKMEFKNYKRSRILNTAFNNFNVGYDRKEQCYYIIAQDMKLFNYNKSITELEIKLFLNGYEIVESNAIQVVGNTLTWYFYPNDNETEKLILKYKKAKEDNVIKDDKNENQIKSDEKNNSTLLVVLFLSFLVILWGIIIIKQKNNKN